MEVHQSTIDNSFPITGRPPSNGHPLRSKEHDVIPVRDDVLWLHSAAVGKRRLKNLWGPRVP